MQALEERLSGTQNNMKSLDKNLGDIVKKRKKAQAELEASRSVIPYCIIPSPSAVLWIRITLMRIGTDLSL